MKDKETEQPVKKSRGRPKTNENYRRFYFQLPEEYKFIIQDYKYPNESDVEFIKRCIIYFCAANDIRKEKSLISAVKNADKVDIKEVAKSIKNLVK